MQPKDQPQCLHEGPTRSTELPPITAHGAHAERRHRFVCAPRLRLGVADFPLAALEALELAADRLLFLWRLRGTHVFRNHDLILFLALRAPQLIMCHDDKPCGSNFTHEYMQSELVVGLVLEVLVEGAHFRLVGVGCFGLVFVECCELDVAGDPEDFVGHWDIFLAKAQGLRRNNENIRSSDMNAKPSYISFRQLSRT